MFKRFIVPTLVLFALPVPAFAATVYGDHDPGAGSLAAAPNSVAAAASFDAVLTSATIVDFEGALGDLSITGDGFIRDSQRCGASLCGYNTTLGGADFLDVTFNTTFNFSTAIEAFGAYFTGVQRADATLTYIDGSTTTLTLPTASLASGGTSFFGFTDFGRSITSISYFTGTGGDFVGVDDIRYQTAGVTATPIPLPASLPLLLAGFGALSLVRRKG